MGSWTRGGESDPHRGLLLLPTPADAGTPTGGLSPGPAHRFRDVPLLAVPGARRGRSARPPHHGRPPGPRALGRIGGTTARAGVVVEGGDGDTGARIRGAYERAPSVQIAHFPYRGRIGGGLPHCH